MKDSIKAGVNNPKTTLAGVLAFVVAAAECAQAQFDGDPATVAQWGVAISAALVAFALWQARDSDVSSEQAGA